LKIRVIRGSSIVNPRVIRGSSIVNLRVIRCCRL